MMEKYLTSKIVLDIMLIFFLFYCKCCKTGETNVLLPCINLVAKRNGA